MSTGHLLIGILRDESSSAATLLTARGARLDDVRAALGAIHVDQEPPAPFAAMRRPAIGRPFRRPPNLPSSPGVRIVPARNHETGTSSHAAEDYWLLEGFTLRAALARILRDDNEPFHEPRIQWTAPVNPDVQYDIALVLGPGERRQDRVRLLLHAIEQHFNLSIVRELQRMDVYVLTAPEGIRAARRESADFGGGLSSIEASFGARRASLSSAGAPSDRAGAFSSSGMTMDVFSRVMAEVLGRPVVNETRLSGAFEVELPGLQGTLDEFTDRLRSQRGFALTPAQRDVTIHVVRSVAS